MLTNGRVYAPHRRLARLLASLAPFFALVAALAPTPTAQAADTYETYLVGETVYELHLGMTGLGLERYQKEISGDLVLAVGLVERMSGYLGTSASANEHFGGAAGGYFFGLFGTPVETDHFSVDLILESGFHSGTFALTPGLELNFDAQPEQTSWGVYLRLAANLTGRDEPEVADTSALASAEDSTNVVSVFAPDSVFTLGAYWTFLESHQLLLQWEAGLSHKPLDGEDAFSPGTVSLGHNVMVTDAIELINEVNLGLPAGGSPVSFGFSAGLIVYVP